MSDSGALRILKYGKHASANDFETAAASQIFLEPLNDLDVSGLKQGKNERQTLRGDAERNARINGAKECAFSYSLIGRGCSGNDGTAVAAGDLELATLLDVAFGQAGSYDGDAATADTVSALSEATPSMTVTTSGADFTAGNAVLFPAGASATEVTAREVVSIATNALTLDRGGWAGSTTGGTVYPSASWYLNPRAHSRVHGYHRFEGEGWGREADGCMVSQLVIRVPPNGGYVTFDFAWQAADWADIAEANPTFSAPSAGSPIVALDSPFYLGDGSTFAKDAEFFANEITITITNTLQPRTTPSAVNGIAGYHVADSRVSVAGSLYLGSLTSDGTDALLALLNTSGQTFDCGLQVGREAAAAMYCRWPALDFDADIGSINGMDAIAFTAHGTRSGNHSNVPGAMRLHLF